MKKAQILQALILFLILTISYFTFNHLNNDKSINITTTENNLNNTKKIEKEELENSNKIEELSYKSLDDSGNIYEIKSDSGSVTEEDEKILLLKNVTAKISGLIAYGNPETWSIEDIRPYFEETVAAFGHQRVIWGSDSPVCNLGGGLETWVSATHVLTNSWSRAHRDSLFWSNAAELWKLDVNF